MSVRTNYRHKPTGWRFVTESSSLPVAVVTGDLLFPLSDLKAITIPLTVFQDQIKNSDEWEESSVPQVHDDTV